MEQNIVTRERKAVHTSYTTQGVLVYVVGYNLRYDNNLHRGCIDCYGTLTVQPTYWHEALYLFTLNPEDGLANNFVRDENLFGVMFDDVFTTPRPVQNNGTNYVWQVSTAMRAQLYPQRLIEFTPQMINRLELNIYAHR